MKLEIKGLIDVTGTTNKPDFDPEDCLVMLSVGVDREGEDDVNDFNMIIVTHDYLKRAPGYVWGRSLLPKLVEDGEQTCIWCRVSWKFWIFGRGPRSPADRAGETIEGETDAFSTGTNNNGVADAFKWIDAYDATVSQGQNGFDVELSWVGNKHTDGKLFKRKVACFFPGISGNEQSKGGGKVASAKVAFGSNPGPIFREWLWNR